MTGWRSNGFGWLKKAKIMILFNSSSLEHSKSGQLNINSILATLKAVASRKALVGLARRIKAHKEMEKLQRLDDHMLKDIGLERADLDWAMAQADEVDPLAALQIRRTATQHAHHLATAKAYCAAVAK